LDDGESVSELARVLLGWRESMDAQRERVQAVSNRVRSRSWDDMAVEIVSLMDDRFGH
jgi:hypothetical protein